MTSQTRGSQARLKPRSRFVTTKTWLRYGSWRSALVNLKQHDKSTNWLHSSNDLNKLLCVCFACGNYISHTDKTIRTAIWTLAYIENTVGHLSHDIQYPTCPTHKQLSVCDSARREIWNWLDRRTSKSEHKNRLQLQDGTLGDPIICSKYSVMSYLTIHQQGNTQLDPTQPHIWHYMQNIHIKYIWTIYIYLHIWLTRYS